MFTACVCPAARTCACVAARACLACVVEARQSGCSSGEAGVEVQSHLAALVIIADVREPAVNVAIGGKRRRVLRGSQHLNGLAQPVGSTFSKVQSPVGT